MTITEEQYFDLLGRTTALEHLLKQMIWNVIVARVDADGGDDDEVIKSTEDFTDDLSRFLGSSPFPGIDPALSGHLSAVSRDHALRILRELLSEMEANKEAP